jgi:hypothetical protein
MSDNKNRIQFDVQDILSGDSENFNHLLTAWIADDAKRNDVNLKFPLACRQMSQFVAWTWLDDAETKAETDLKERFKQALENQAKDNQPKYSQEISDLVIGKEPQGTLTLPKQYKKLAGEFPEYVYTPDLVECFYFEVVKSNKGYIAFQGEKPDDKTSKIIVAVPYPNRPELSESQLKELRIWATDNSGEGWQPSQNWIPFASF